MSRSATVRRVLSPTCSFEIAASAGNSSPFLRRPAIVVRRSPMRRAVTVAGRKPLDVLTMSPAKPLGNEDVQRSPDRLGLRVTKDLLRSIVEYGDSLLVIDGDDCIGRNRNDPGKLRLGLLKPLFRDFDLFDIGAGAEPFTDLPVRARAAALRGSTTTGRRHRRAANGIQANRCRGVVSHAARHPTRAAGRQGGKE